VRAHLEALVAAFGQLGKPEILDTPGRDYACRIIVPIGVWANVTHALVMQIDYHNFKGRVGHRDKVYALWLGTVWQRGHAVQRLSDPHDVRLAATADPAGLTMPQLVARVRSVVNADGWRGVGEDLWHAMVTHGLAERSDSQHMLFDLTEIGQQLIGVIV